MGDVSLLNWRHPEPARNLIDLLEDSADKFPNFRYCSSSGLRLGYADTLCAVRGFAGKYQSEIEGKKVAIFMANSPFFLITYLGVLYSGGVPALLNAATPARTGAALMEELSPALAFSDHPLPFDGSAALVDAAAVAEWIAADQEASSRCGAGDEPATYFYTGGTTGVPKRVIYTHHKILRAGERMQWGWPLRQGEVFLPIAPFSHIYGYLMGVCMPLQCAGGSVIPSRFKPSEILDLLEREKVTVLGGGPPAIYQALLADPTLSSRDLRSLRVCPGGGAPIPVEVHRRWKDATGLTIFEGYGMTEIAPIAVNTVDAGHLAGAAGKPVPDTQIEIVDLETGTVPQPAGRPGEIRVRGPHMMAGYCNNPEESAQALRDGWIYTGDVGVIDGDGFLVITDRKKDVILFNGFNVFPREVEEALIAHPDVSSASVVGAPDERTGEIVVAYVTCREGTSPTSEDLIEHCREYLVAYRLPGRIVQIGMLPLTAAGKVDRKALRVLAEQEAEDKCA